MPDAASLEALVFEDLGEGRTRLQSAVAVRQLSRARRLAAERHGGRRQRGLRQARRPAPRRRRLIRPGAITVGSPARCDRPDRRRMAAVPAHTRHPRRSRGDRSPRESPHGCATDHHATAAVITAAGWRHRLYTGTARCHPAVLLRGGRPWHQAVTCLQWLVALLIGAPACAATPPAAAPPTAPPSTAVPGAIIVHTSTGPSTGVPRLSTGTPRVAPSSSPRTTTAVSTAAAWTSPSRRSSCTGNPGCPRTAFGLSAADLRRWWH